MRYRSFVIGVPVALLLVLVVTLSLSIRSSLRAERALNANLLAVELVGEYVTSNHGKWPRSWNDLERLPDPRQAIFDWPRDSAEVKAYVRIDFGADENVLAHQSPKEFEAISPVGACYPFKDGPEVRALLEKLREGISRRNEGERGAGAPTDGNRHSG